MSLLTNVAGGFAVTFVRNETQQHQNASSEASSRYSHSTLNSFTPLVPSCMEFMQFALVIPIST